MKTVKYILLMIIFSFFITWETFAVTCDQSFENNFVRYQYSYDFFDSMTNSKPWSKDLFLNSWNVNYTNPQFLDKWVTYDNWRDFDWTKAVTDASFKIPKWTNNLKIITTKAADWKIAKHPTTRTSSKAGSHDFMLTYKIWYDYSGNHPITTDDLTHTECAYYSVTWCGDWVTDTKYWEQCDDWNSIDWDSCSNTCKNVVVPEVCSAWITWIQTAPISATTPKLCDNYGETVVNFTSTKTWNKTNYTWNCKAWTTIKKWWDCNASYTAPVVVPVCSAWITWTQTAPISATTPKLCDNYGETVVNFTSTKTWNKTNYTWNCKAWTTIKTWGDCIASYTPPSVCSAWISWVQTAPISATTPKLCDNYGETAINFTSKKIWNTINYVWNCKKWSIINTWWDCNASYTVVPKVVCDQIFENNFVRYNYSYDFFDSINNSKAWSADLYLNTWQVDYNNPEFLNKWVPHANWKDFDWTKAVKDAWNKIIKWTNNLKILSTKASDWQIAKHPTTRTPAKVANHDFMISYKIGYDYTNNYPDASDDAYLTECAYYSVTWCGDWVTDTKYWEQCDDWNSIDWDSCSNTCKNVTTPVCTAWVTWTQTAPISSSTPKLCATVWETVTNFSTSINWNTTSYTWNCKSWTTIKKWWNCSASYNSWGGWSSCLNGSVTWLQTSPVTATTTWLCQNWLNVWNFTSTVTWNSTSYSWSCGWISGWWCYASYNSWWGVWSSCLNGAVTWLQTSPVTATTTWLCQNWLNVWNFTSTVTWNSTSYSWSCGWISGWWCYASYNSWRGGWKTFCWDGRVQRPNTDLKNEECDFWSATDWLYCNKDCTYKENTIPGHCQNNWATCEITTPRGWAMIFWPSDNVIIWSGMNPYTDHWLSRPFIRNKSEYDLYFDEICVVKKTGSTIIWADDCEPAWIIKSWQIKYYLDTPSFIWKNITTWNYGDNRIITTIKHNWVRYDNAYFVSNLDVRVAKSSVATVWGWTSYLKDTSSVWNISDVANNWKLNPKNNKNFVWVWVSTWDISSYTNDVKDSKSVKIIEKLTEKYSKSIKKVSDTDWTIVWNTSSLSDFKNYNWIKNVYILKNKNFVVDSSIFNGITGSRTYIIENWNLKINKNIVYSDNIAFVVKWWNILIHKDVTNIDWTYVTIAKDTTGWKFQWTWWTSLKILNVNGSLYWNISNLVVNRTYVKQNSSNQIDVWTIVSFGSKLFRKPSPLISTFIDEYLQSEKISK
jgi:cysteine-rich repeat protein